MYPEEKSVMTVRTRFAPSPTGLLHIGSARTALYAWLYARHHQGQFILRIEDTDRERSTPEAVEVILQGMQWLGLDWDEGPFFQTERFDLYQKVAYQLLDAGKAYRCYCSKERLEKLRAEQLVKKQKPRYDGYCRDKGGRNDNLPFVIRFRNPTVGQVIFEDQVHGLITVSNQELDDLILLRADGSPTYNFTVVVDDWGMQITHVIRGDDHLNNTPRQINILKALDAPLPIYAHVPMILGADGKKLSKREGAASILEYQEEGYLPEAIVNYLVRLGWSHHNQEIFSRKELIDLFDLKDLNKSPSAMNIEKLRWLNQHYIKNSDISYLASVLQYYLERLGVSCQEGPSLEAVVELQAERVKTMLEMASKSLYFYQDIHIDKEQLTQLQPAVIEAIKVFRTEAAMLMLWSVEELHLLLKKIEETLQVSFGSLSQGLRLLLTGGSVSPPIDKTLAVLGKEKVLLRLEQGMKLASYME